MSNGYRTLSQHLNDLKKENFSLKLRIYFLEEQLQRKYEAGQEDVYRRNISLRVEVESLKQELQEKQQGRDSTWGPAEPGAGQDEPGRCQQEEDRGQEEERECQLDSKGQILQVRPGQGFQDPLLIPTLWLGTGPCPAHPHLPPTPPSTSALPPAPHLPPIPSAPSPTPALLDFSLEVSSPSLL
uniref:Centrosomin N-terminal motif 1 domain-containing protein n=1 Tax=Ornithorhynchus anatinus TaxID=9258 RepID=A0A6I8NPV5_ORNAN